MKHWIWVWVVRGNRHLSPFFAAGHKSPALISPIKPVSASYAVFPTIVNGVREPIQRRAAVKSSERRLPPPVIHFLRDPKLVQNNVPTPVKVDRLNKCLDRYDPTSRQFLINGFTFGFRIPFIGTRTFRLCCNLKSATNYPDILQEKLSTEIANGRIAGPFPQPPFQNMQISPLGLVPKKTRQVQVKPSFILPKGCIYQRWYTRLFLFCAIPKHWWCSNARTKVWPWVLHV